ncbi:hypothetical protein ACWIGI_37780 [Nocardia sp. NPDC055321]
MISPTARLRFARSRTDLTTATLTALTCLVLFAGLAALTGSYTTALAGGIGLGAALVLAVKMIALPVGPHPA